VARVRRAILTRIHAGYLASRAQAMRSALKPAMTVLISG